MEKNVLLLATFLLLFAACTQPIEPPKDELLHSFVDDQWMYEGTHMSLFVHTVHEIVHEVEYTLKNEYDFINLESHKGQATISLNPPRGNIGIIPLSLQITKGERVSILNFNIDIRKQPSHTINVDHGNINASLFIDQLSIKDTVLVILKNKENIDLNVIGTKKALVYIFPAANYNTSLKSIKIEQAEKIHIKGFTIDGAELTKKQPFVKIDSSAHDISISNCKIGQYPEAEQWTPTELKEKLRNGIFTYGDSIKIVNNLIQATYHGIETNGNYNQVGYNIVDRFGGDAIRNTGSDGVFYNNTLKNATIDDYHAPDGNHDDLFQSWTFGQPIKNITLKNNIAIAYADKDLKHYSNIVQGLVCFDGFTENWQVYNNLVLVDHPHGICLLGARNCEITNNTISRNPRKIKKFESEPWIMIGPHKNGSPGQGNIVKNNLVPTLELSKTGGCSSSNNIVIDSSYTLFHKDPLDWDFRLKDGCSAINAGIENGAPSEDIIGHDRPQGKAIDVGCYEKEEN